MGNPFAMHLAQNELQVEQGKWKGESEGEDMRELATTCDYRHLTWAEAGTARHRRVARGAGQEASSNANLMQQRSRAEQQKEHKEQMEQEPSKRSESTKQAKKTRSQAVAAKEHPRCLDTARGESPSPRGQVQNIYSTIANSWALEHPALGQVKRVD